MRSREIQYINFAFIINVSQSVPILPSPFATSKKHKIKSKANACIQGIMNPSSCAVCIFPRVGKGYSFFLGGMGFSSSGTAHASKSTVVEVARFRGFAGGVAVARMFGWWWCFIFRPEIVDGGVCFGTFGLLSPSPLSRVNSEWMVVG